jgi:hypothetical protein
MIQVYLFLAAFAVQILTISVLFPARFTRVIRAELASVPAERLAEVYPGVDVGQAYERFLARYRAANRIVTVFGLLLLIWFLRYTQRPDWDESRVSGMVTVYFLLQNLPLMSLAWLVTKFNKLRSYSPPERVRKASLQRRGLLDFVSPFTVVLGVAAYFLFAAFMFYIARHPFPGFAGPFVNIGIITLMYAVLACVVYWMMYGRKRGPLETNAVRMRVTRAVVSSYAYICILVPIFLSFSFARKLLDLETWSPLGRSVSFLILMLFVLRIQRFTAQPR